MARTASTGPPPWLSLSVFAWSRDPSRPLFLLVRARWIVNPRACLERQCPDRLVAVDACSLSSAPRRSRHRRAPRPPRCAERGRQPWPSVDGLTAEHAEEQHPLSLEIRGPTALPDLPSLTMMVAPSSRFAASPTARTRGWSRWSQMLGDGGGKGGYPGVARHGLIFTLRVDQGG